MNEICERLTRVEDFLGTPQTDEAVSLAVEVGRLSDEVRDLNSARGEMVRDVEDRFSSIIQDFITLVDSTKENSKRMEEELTLLKRAVAGSSFGGDGGPSSSKLKVPEPKSFNGNRNVKELENFL